MQNLEISRSYGLTFDGQSMLRLSFSTAILVATFLSIPDALAIMPTTKELPALIVRICGLWLSAFIQWQLAFLCILSFLSWLNGPIVVSDSGIKLSRFSRIIAWSEISALTCQSGPVFFKWLPFVEPVARLNLFVGENKKRLKTKNLDSLLFKTQDFRKLFLIISKRCFAIAPDCEEVFLSTQLADPVRFRNSHEGIERKRKLFTAYVSIMLLAFVGRTTLRNYLYNDSARDLNTHNYVAAKKKLDLATNIDGGFSYGWDRLARVEFRTNDSENAERHWLLALKKKPDLVSAKVGLSSIYMKSGQYEKAKILLNSARRLAPRDIATLINLGHINLVLGKKDCAIENFNKAVTLSGGDVTVCKAVTNALYQADISDYKKKQK